MRRAVLLLALIFVLAGCASDDPDRDRRGGFYGGVSGGLHP